jgi:hypothetical protein
MTMGEYFLFTDALALAIIISSAMARNFGKKSMLRAIGISYLVTMQAILAYLQCRFVVISRNLFIEITVTVIMICYLTFQLLSAIFTK